ncbi:PTS glucitol/sorbitol transporter subunit IIA [Propionispira raffinosivorans]|uniref:PTS glucitol/sorbitol transporter subunit IIA n=1 Tax=Propionispira raffinosivorans TaxID=86959 RepID=UPI00036017C8|nr:PTS glucitol/sorbitol transporter subunit IIA [Propionispira raffinosivorans]
MQIIYKTKVVKLGSLVESFKSEKMMILFNENAPEELVDYCVLHDGNQLQGLVKIGDIFQINQRKYKIVFVGNQVQKNLQDLGHITLRFNNNQEGESLEGSLYLEDLPIGAITLGDELTIIRV